MTHLAWHGERGRVPGIALLEGAPESDGIDLKAVRLYRQAPVRSEMKARGIAALILSDPINIRYASGIRNTQVFSMRNAPSRYRLLTADRSILFEFTGCLHLAVGFDTVDQVRPASTASFVAAGPLEMARAIKSSDEVKCVQVCAGFAARDRNCGRGVARAHPPRHHRDRAVVGASQIRDRTERGLLRDPPAHRGSTNQSVVSGGRSQRDR